MPIIQSLLTCGSFVQAPFIIEIVWTALPWSWHRSNSEDVSQTEGLSGRGVDPDQRAIRIISRDFLLLVGQVASAFVDAVFTDHQQQPCGVIPEHLAIAVDVRRSV